MTTTDANTSLRFPCCEHCIDIKEGCPRSDGHGSPCPITPCEVGVEPSRPVDFTPAWIDEPGLAELYQEDKELEKRADLEELQRVKEDRVDHQHMREDLVDKVISLVGHEPPGIRVLLRTLSHPDIVKDARLYFDSMDASSRCTKYEPPWNCAREAEARYQNIKYGWTGGAGGIGFDESWCDNCRDKVMGT